MNVKALEKVALSVRTLSMDAIQKAKSGHPGLPMGAAELAAVLYGEILKHNPADSKWADRDRFVLSAGHGSMLLYSILHLSGYKVTLDDIKSFRQIGSKCPGHPEAGETDGVEATTGPLGQGVSMAVGMALAESMLAAHFNTDDYKVVDHYTYALVGEGCLMEGVSSEASSFAGTNKLGKLIVFYDENNITIDGNTNLAFTEDIAKRYEAYGWQILRGSMYDMADIAKLVEQAKKEADKPTLIMLKSVIGKGCSLVAGTSKAHGAPLGDEGIATARKELGVPADADFYIAPEATEYFKDRAAEFASAEDAWKKTFDAWAAKYPEKKAEWDAWMAGKPTADAAFPAYNKGDSIATRNASGPCLAAVSASYTNLVGGSADLQGPNVCKAGTKDYNPENRDGRYIRFGIREFGMAAICNGIALHGGLRAYCATFAVFADYLRPALRLSALMGVPVIYILTHDSIYVGEDGPTHQPIETMSALRAMPNVQVLRPADAEEAVEAWKIAAETKNKPTCMAFTRQNLPVFEKDDPDWKNTVRAGAYIAKKGADAPDVTVLAAGSEVSLALAAAELVTDKKVRVVSVLDRENFKSQPDTFKNALIGGAKRVVCAEAGTKMGWEGLATGDDCLFCIDRFGESGPYAKVAEDMGFTAENLAKMIRG